MTLALMCSNCALRSGCRAPSSALRLCWREKPSCTSSLRTVSALIGCPIAVSVSASLSMLFDTQISRRIGSPRVAGSTRRFSAGTSPGSVVLTALRPAPDRRTFPLANGAASRSSSPRLIVERARPVICETTARPPQPAALTSPAANNRRPRSSSFEPTVSQRVRIASSSIMPSGLRLFVRNRNPSDLSHSAARPQNAIQLLFGVALGCALATPSVGAQPTRGAAEQGKPAEFGRLYERWQQAKDPEQRIKLAEEVLALEPTITAWELAAPREHIKEELWFVIAKAYFDRRRGGWADNLEKAIVALEAALTVRTHEALP